MRLIFHIFQKDARHLKWPLLLFYLLMGAQALIVGSGVDVSLDRVALASLGLFVRALWFLQALMLLTIISMLIHEDSLVGTTSFWLTRPISRWSLLISKFLFVAFLLLLPMALAELSVLIANGATGSDALFAAIELIFSTPRLSLSTTLSPRWLF